MRQLHQDSLIFLMVLFFLLLSSCMHTKKAELDDSITLSRQYLNIGDYQKALDTDKLIYTKYPNDQTFVSSYIKTIEDIRRSSDRAFSNEDFSLSGRIYGMLIRNYSDFKGFASRLSFNRDYLNTRIKDCSEFLTKKALEEYRKGNLTHAISIWKGILAFDPDNIYAKKSIETTSIQRKHLHQNKSER